MNRMYKMALLAALGMISVSAAKAVTQNELYLGFTSGTASSDLVINLGLASTFSQTSTVDLSSYLSSSELSTFNSIFTSGPGGQAISLSVAGGDSAFGHGDVFGTQPSGSTVTINTTSSSLTGAAGVVQGDANLSATVGGFQADSSKAWTGVVNPASGTSFVGKSGLNPNVGLSSGVVTADLWEVAPSGVDTLEGTFTYDYSLDGGGAVASQSLTFAGVNVTSVPEPTTFGLLAGAGLLVVSLRNQIRRKQA